MLEKTWKTLAGEKVDLRSILESELRAAHADPGMKAEVIIACDSQQVGKDTEYVTVVVVHRTGLVGGKGGRVFFCRERIPRVRELRERLWKEAWRSVELAMELTTTPDIGESYPIEVSAIHIDANVDPKHKSSKYVEELVGLVMGQGFKAVVKPEAFAASHAADHAVKHKDERRKPHAERRGGRAA
jgi:predicted RNase H-related nuclease YkuK (DUF458 family)